MAIAAGYPTADAYLDSIEPHEWAEALAFSIVEPWGAEAAARQQAEIVRLLAMRLGIEITRDEITTSWGFAAPDDHWEELSDDEAYAATEQAFQLVCGI